MSYATELPAPPPGCSWEIRRHLDLDYYSVILKRGRDTIGVEGVFAGAWGEQHFRQSITVAARRILRELHIGYVESSDRR